MIFGSLLLIGGFHTQIVVMFDNCDSRLFAGYMKEYEGGPPALLPESWPAPENAEERKNAGGMKKQLQSFCFDNTIRSGEEPTRQLLSIFTDKSEI